MIARFINYNRSMLLVLLLLSTVCSVAAQKDQSSSAPTTTTMPDVATAAATSSPTTMDTQSETASPTTTTTKPSSPEATQDPIADANIVPGDAAWLGSGEMVDEAPLDFAAYLPLLFVIMGHGAVAIPRVIIEPDQECPVLVLLPANNGTASTATTRLANSDIPEVTLRGVGDMELPHAFPIKMCETRLDTAEQKNAWNSGLLAFEGIQDKDKVIKIPTDPQRFLLLADTGLRVKATNLGLGKCNGTDLYGIPQCAGNFTEADLQTPADGDFQGLDNWPLSDLMARAAETKPDLVAIMGDYLYRQSPCPANNTANADCAAINIPANFANTDIPPGAYVNFVPGHWGDNWFGWWADFFYPALAILQSAPLIACRGNHENCARAGYGYLFLLDQAPYNGTDAGSYCRDYTPPYSVPFEQEQFLVMDDNIISPLNKGIDHFNFTNGTCPVAPTDGSLIVPTPQNRYLDQNQDNATIDDQLSKFTGFMKDIREMSLSHETNFYLSHRPVFAVACDGNAMQTLDWTMQQSLNNNTLDRVVAMVGGHMHWLEALSFVNQSLPAQLVVGHGGTSKIPNFVDQAIFPSLQLQVGPQNKLQGRIEKGMSDSRMFGFAQMDRNGETLNYDIKFLSLNPTTTDADLNIPEVVELQFQMTIPKGPRVVPRGMTAEEGDATTTSDDSTTTAAESASDGATSDGIISWSVGVVSIVVANSLLLFGSCF